VSTPRWDPGQIYYEPPARSTQIPQAPEAMYAAPVTVHIDGHEVAVPPDSTILEACRTEGIETPTLCTLESLTPVNACRLCVVELAGSRTLVPACSRKVEAGMEVSTDSERVRHSRRLVLELLGSSVDVTLAGARQPDSTITEWMDRYGADPGRFGPAAQTVAQPVKVDNDLYVRDYSRCILCYKCVEACGEDAQNTFAIAVAGRGFDAHIATEFDVPLPESACVYCGNCIGVCPTGALMSRREHDMRAEGTWDEGSQAVTSTICPYCGVGCGLDVHVQGDEIVKVSSPMDSSVTEGHLCIKGRFGFDFVRGAAKPRS
jgi:predicted molibdopterin-dependent oxidoreductase YjgC